MSATVTSLAPRLRDSTLIELGRIQGLAKAEADMAQELRDVAAKFTELAERHQVRHIAATAKADEISLRLRNEA